MAEEAPAVTPEWRRLSAWSIFHFSVEAVIQNVQAAYFFVPATYGVARSGFNEFTLMIPIGIIVVVLVNAILNYIFYSYRVLEDSIQVRRGALFKKRLNLSFERIQNVNLEHPFYFRPFGLVTLKIDSAGSAGEEVNVAALRVPEAEAIRSYVAARKRAFGRPAEVAHDDASRSAADVERVFFTRSLFDLVIHGLTNNRTFLLIAGIFTFVWQTNFSFNRLVEALGIDFDLIIGGWSIVRLTVLFIVSFILAIGFIALLSVLIAIVTYYGFTVYRTDAALTIKRGLLTKHEIHVRKSRIQTVTVRQDWLDYLLGRRNIVLERISHRQHQGDPWAEMKRKILVPSVKLHETTTLTDEVLPGCRLEQLSFTPIRKRYFYKHAVIRSGIYLLALTAYLFIPNSFGWFVPLVLAIWPVHVLSLYMRWKRAGIAVDGDLIVVRSGVIGIDYHSFPAFKTQDISHIQSILMKRHNVSNLVFHTASTTIKIPYLSSDVAKAVVNYCVYRVEATEKSWM